MITPSADEMTLSYPIDLFQVCAARTGLIFEITAHVNTKVLYCFYIGCKIKTMPHIRQRYATSLLEKTLAHSPVVGILGQRQTGKTTLASGVSKDYETLDLSQTLESAASDPEHFLVARKHPFAIDECQLLPELFPALKEHVRKHPRRGQFILTGSVRFTSRRAIRESLTGRIVNLELLPLSVAESHSEKFPDFLIRLVRSAGAPEIQPISAAWLAKMKRRFELFLETGGLPGICFFRERHVRAARFETQLETLLERDIRLIINTEVPYRRLKALLRQLAIDQGQPLNLAALAKVASVTPPTLKKLLQAMEAMFLIRSIETEKQVRPVIFLEDQGMASYLAAEEISPETNLARGLFASILPQFLYRPETTPVFYQYRTRGGAKVDIAIRTPLGRLGVIPVSSDVPTSSALASARSFVSDSPKARVVIAHTGSDFRKVSENIISLPYPLLISDDWR